MGHRGIPARYPENTLAGVRKAIELGSEAIEIDVQASSDGIPVLMHDLTVDRTTKHSGDASLRIRNLRPEVYGSITQSIPAAPHLGKKLRFSVWLRTDDVVANAYQRDEVVANISTLVDKARAEMLVHGSAHDARERERREQRDDEHARHDRRRAEHAPPAVTP